MGKNNEKIKEFKSYITLKKQFAETKERYKELRESMGNISIQKISDMPKTGSNNDKIAELLVKIEEIEECKLKLSRKFLEIENKIETLKDVKQKRVMELRYLDGITFERIAVAMGFSWNHVHRIHSKALNNIKI